LHEFKEKRKMLRINYKFIPLTVMLLFVLSGCATAVIVNPADSETIQAANTFAPKEGMAKVYFLGGKTGTAISFPAKMVGGAILVVDGNQVGPIDKNDVMVLDVVPNEYNFSWQYPRTGNVLTEATGEMKFLTKQLSAGDVLILQAYHFTGGGGFAFGLGNLISPPEFRISEVYDRALVMGKRFVKPITCPNTIC
jgi:hypothetical protein